MKPMSYVTPLGQFFPEVAKQEKARIEQPGLLDGLDPLSSRVYDSLPRRACASVDSLVQVRWARCRRCVGGFRAAAISWQGKSFRRRV